MKNVFDGLNTKRITKKAECGQNGIHTRNVLQESIWTSTLPFLIPFLLTLLPKSNIKVSTMCAHK